MIMYSSSLSLPFSRESAGLPNRCLHTFVWMKDTMLSSRVSRLPFCSQPASVSHNDVKVVQARRGRSSTPRYLVLEDQELKETHANADAGLLELCFLRSRPQGVSEMLPQLTRVGPGVAAYQVVARLDALLAVLHELAEEEGHGAEAHTLQAEWGARRLSGWPRMTNAMAAAQGPETRQLYEAGVRTSDLLRRGRSTMLSCWALLPRPESMVISRAPRSRHPHRSAARGAGTAQLSGVRVRRRPLWRRAVAARERLKGQTAQRRAAQSRGPGLGAPPPARAGRSIRSARSGGPGGRCTAPETSSGTALAGALTRSSRGEGLGRRRAERGRARARSLSLSLGVTLTHMRRGRITPAAGAAGTGCVRPPSLPYPRRTPSCTTTTTTTPATVPTDCYARSRASARAPAAVGIHPLLLAAEARAPAPRGAAAAHGTLAPAQRQQQQQQQQQHGGRGGSAGGGGGVPDGVQLGDGRAVGHGGVAAAARRAGGGRHPGAGAPAGGQASVYVRRAAQRREWMGARLTWAGVVVRASRVPVRVGGGDAARGGGAGAERRERQLRAVAGPQPRGAGGAVAGAGHPARRGGGLDVPRVGGHRARALPALRGQQHGPARAGPRLAALHALRAALPAGRGRRDGHPARRRAAAAGGRGAPAPARQRVRRLGGGGGGGAPLAAHAQRAQLRLLLRRLPAPPPRALPPALRRALPAHVPPAPPQVPLGARAPPRRRRLAARWRRG
eukprot:scaffold1211_cov337-Prasinococcus_capsulatus_cf.AAC.8